MIFPTIVPVTQARAKLSELTDQAEGESVIILTKGQQKRALVDLKYLQTLQQTVKLFTQKSYIDQEQLPYTREFSSDEIEEWQKEDMLS